MSQFPHKQLISAVVDSWNVAVPVKLGQASTLNLLASREVTGDGISSALAVAMTWSSAFAVPCSGAATGVLICLFKSDESDQIDLLAKQPGDGLPRAGGRAIIGSVMDGAAAGLSSALSTKVGFGPATYIDLASDETRLAGIVGDVIHIGTFSLAVGDDINTQALLIYAPNGSLGRSAAGVDSNVSPATAASEGAKEPPPSAPAAAPTGAQQPGPAGQQVSRRGGQRRNEVAAPRNIERLLEVELDVIVRFGVTHVPLRDVVRMGVGTMIELNRAVDEPVELLVNGRPLARGEVVVVDGYYGVRITEIGTPTDRAASLLS